MYLGRAHTPSGTLAGFRQPVLQNLANLYSRVRLSSFFSFLSFHELNCFCKQIALAAFKCFFLKNDRIGEALICFKNQNKSTEGNRFSFVFGIYN